MDNLLSINYVHIDIKSPQNLLKKLYDKILNRWIIYYLSINYLHIGILSL